MTQRPLPDFAAEGAPDAFGVAHAAPSRDTTYDVIMDLVPLSDWASQVLSAVARAAAAREQAGVAQAEMARTRALYRDDQSAALKRVQAAEAAASQATADAQAADAAVQRLRREGAAIDTGEQRGRALGADPLADPDATRT